MSKYEFRTFKLQNELFKINNMKSLDFKAQSDRIGLTTLDVSHTGCNCIETFKLVSR
jgi:hypothetical protein